MVENLTNPDKVEHPTNAITSDIPLGSQKQEFLAVPTEPKKENYSSDENYQDAVTEYNRKLEVYHARVEFKQELDREAKETEERKKTIHASTSYQVSQVFKDLKYETFLERDTNNNPIGFKPAKAAMAIGSYERFVTDIKTSTIFYFDGKSWIPNAEPYLEIIVATILNDENRVTHYNNIKHHLIGITLNNIIFSRKIACENGLLNPETQEFADFDKKEMPLHFIPVTYDKTAKSEAWEQFITQVVNQDDLATIQEWSGYLLLADYRFHKLLWIHGDGRNGKGVWQRTMEEILGENNVSSVGLEEFDGNHRFALRQLYGKLFNPCSEPTTNKVLQTPLLKKATGQDTIEAEIKGKQTRLTFRNCAKITVMANRFPKINDNTTAFRERRLFIKFPNEFTGKNQIQNIEQNWLDDPKQRSGILNWMLEGLQRLLTQGYFTESKTQQETEAEFLRASDTISSFITELCIFDKNSYTTRNDAFEAYKNYCDILGLDAENEKKFTSRLKETPKISVGFIRKPKQERVWKGLALKKIDDDGKIDQNVTLTTFATGKDPIYPQTNTDESLVIERESTPVAVVAPVALPNALKVIVEDSGVKRLEVNPEFKQPTFKDVHFRQLPPSEPHQCDGFNCALLAMYDVDGSFWCKSHFDNVNKDCQNNGVRLVEDLPDFPEGEA
jgi:P4 family phage/plasmid primase-like protien